MKFIYSLLILLLTSCGVQWQYTTLNHAAQVDSIYSSPNIQIDTINSASDLRWKLRTDFNFRYDFWNSLTNNEKDHFIKLEL